MKNIEAILQNDGIADISGWFTGALIHCSLISERSDNREDREISVRRAAIAAAHADKNVEYGMDTREDMDAGKKTTHRQEFPADKHGMSLVILQKKDTGILLMATADVDSGSAPPDPPGDDASSTGPNSVMRAAIATAHADKNNAGETTPHQQEFPADKHGMSSVILQKKGYWNSVNGYSRH
jgi:hypothetical protein